MKLLRYLPRKLRRPTMIVAAIWLACVIDAVTLNVLGSGWLFGLRLAGLASVVPLCVLWVRFVRPYPALFQRAVYSICYVLCWPLPVYLADGLGLPGARASLAQLGVAGAFFIGLAWVIWYVERASQRYAVARRKRLIAAEAAASLASVGSEVEPGLPPPVEGRVWNPLDLEAWYYGRRGKKLAQSVWTLFSYSLAFLLAVMMVNQLGGCQEIYEMPAGGGEQKTMAQTLKVQKVIKKKFVINPFSAIIFNPPPIDEVKLQLLEVTQHQYTVGYGSGAGAGFAGGTNKGKVRFIRLEYAGGDWNQDFGVGGDQNMLVEYGARTGQTVSAQTESRTVAQLNNFPLGKSPPLVYLTGQRNIQLSKNEVKILREYLLDKHGMLFGDNGGSGHFHNQFISMMQQVLPNVEPVRIPLDDVVHRIPYQIPFLPYVSPHGGKDAWGWKVDGRWVCYYHPGDIGDAWTDDHSGVAPDTYEYCYQLGTNVIFYAHVEYSKWL
jgi:hypothetical protein